MMPDLLVAVVLQVAGLVASPLLVGLVQTTKARLQGRRGASPLQPYRELRRLWRRRVVDPSDTGPVYRIAPAIVAASIGCAVFVVPVAGSSVGWLGTDMLVLVGLLATARFAVTVAAWEPGGGFALMGAGRDLMFSTFTEPLLLLSLTLVAMQAGSTDLLELTGIVHGPADLARLPLWAAAFGIALVVLVETGRQPIDNPDTHLELTMVHEGPLLEYAGRDLALLQWSAAARHWIMLVLAVGLFVPTGGSEWSSLVVAAVALPVACILIAVIETSFVKLRILRVPALIGIGMAACLLGLVVTISTGGVT